MKPGMIFLLLSGLVLADGCQFGKSVKKDLISGLLTKGEGRCGEDYLTVNREILYYKC